MNKLTTELLEKFISDIKTDGMCDITDHQVESALIRLLAYEQAAKNPAAKIEWDGSEFSVNNVSGEFYYGTTDVYLAPALPKQPELVVLTDEQIDAVLDSNANMAYIISDKRERLRMFAREIIRTAMISTAPAQPVIPEQPKTELVDLSQQVEILNRILNWILKELPVPTQKATVMAIRLSSVIDVISDLEVSTQEQEQK